MIPNSAAPTITPVVEVGKSDLLTGDKRRLYGRTISRKLSRKEAGVARQIKYEAPKDLDELYRIYSEWVSAHLYRLGIEPNNIPDETHNLILRFYEKGGIERYDPEKKFRVGKLRGKPYTVKEGEEDPEGFVFERSRTAPFMSLFKAFIVPSSLAARDRQNNRNKHEGPVDFSAPGLVLERSPTSAESSPMRENLREELRESLDQACESLQGKKVREIDLQALFVRAQQMFEESDKIDRRALAEEFGVSVTAVHKAFASLKEELSEQGLRPSVHTAA